MRMRYLPGKFALVVSATILFPASSMSQDVGGLIGGLIRGAAEAQRQQQLRDQEQQQIKLQQRAVLLEQRRNDAELRAQQRIENDRREAQLHEQEDTRQKRETLARLIPAAKALIEDATSFLRANQSNPKALDFVEQINGLNSALTDGDPIKLQNLMQSLAADLRREPGYGKLEGKRLEQQQADADLYLPELVKSANRGGPTF